MATRRDRENRDKRRSSASSWANDQQGFQPTAVKLPSGVKLFNPEDGENVIDIIPYMVKSGSDVKGGNPKADSGFPYFCRTFVVHRIPGTGQIPNPYVCLECFGESNCPGCEWLKRNPDADEDLKNSIRGQTRHLWIVNDKPGDEKNPLRVYNSVHYNRKLGFGEQMVEAIKAQLGDDENFDDLEHGYKIRFVSEGEYKKVPRLDFKKRNYTYPESIMDHGIDLDACLIHTDAETMRNLLEFGEDTPNRGKQQDNERKDEPKPKHQEDDDPKPPTKKSPFSKGEYVEYKGMECEVQKINADGTLRLLDDEGEPIDRDVDPVRVKKVKVADKDDENEDRPATAKKTTPSRPAKEDDDELEDELEDEDDEDEDEPRRPRSSKR